MFCYQIFKLVSQGLKAHNYLICCNENNFNKQKVCKEYVISAIQCFLYIVSTNIILEETN